MQTRSTFLKRSLGLVLSATLLLSYGTANTASGELGTGKINTFAVYGAAQGVYTIVWSLNDATIPFAPGCSFLVLTAATMGLDSYKLAVSVLTVAKVTGAPVRFYSHAPRDWNGCGVDYVQLL
jgi:hypothetical protein